MSRLIKISHELLSPYCITVDPSVYSYAVTKETPVEDPSSKNFGKNVSKSLGYYSSISGALIKIAEIKAHEIMPEEIDLEDYIEIIVSSNEAITGCLDEIIEKLSLIKP